MTTPATDTTADRNPRPVGDNRQKILEATMNRFQYQGDALSVAQSARTVRLSLARAAR